MPMINDLSNASDLLKGDNTKAQNGYAILCFQNPYRVWVLIHRSVATLLWIGIKWLARRTICVSKSVSMHDIIISLFINRYDFSALSSLVIQQL